MDVVCVTLAVRRTDVYGMRSRCLWLWMYIDGASGFEGSHVHVMRHIMSVVCDLKVKNMFLYWIRLCDRESHMSNQSVLATLPNWKPPVKSHEKTK